jgi:hypothetical protein
MPFMALLGALSWRYACKAAHSMPGRPPVQPPSAPPPARPPACQPPTPCLPCSTHQSGAGGSAA